MDKSYWKAPNQTGGGASGTIDKSNPTYGLVILRHPYQRMERMTAPWMADQIWDRLNGRG
ncbi:MAG: hypothetical protein ACLR84_00205 [Clostridia bacterium]